MKYKSMSMLPLFAALTASIFSAAACLPDETTIDAPAELPQPEPLQPVPLVSPEVAAARKRQAEMEQKVQQFQNYFSPELREALDLMDWGPLPEGTEVPVLSYANLPAKCFTEYVQISTFRYENDLGGMMKAAINTGFQLEFTKNPKTEAISAVYNPKRYLGLLIYPNRSDIMFYQAPAARLKRQTFALNTPYKFFSQTISPAFFINTVKAMPDSRGKGGKIKYPAENIVSLFQFLPPLPAESAPGATADWNYSLIFDTNMPADKRDPSKIELLTWLRVRDQKAALLRATWPADDYEWLAADPDMAAFFIKDRKDMKAFLRQSGPAVAEFIVAENGQILMAQFKGTTVTTTKSTQDAEVFSRRSMRVQQATRTVTDVERGYFSASLRAVGDCSGNFLKPLEPEPLTEEEIQTLTEEFMSKYTIGRKKEAIAMLSPDVRFGFSDEYMMMFLDEFFKVGGIDTFGRPSMMLSGKLDEDKEVPLGLTWRGINKKLNTNTYSISIGLRINGKPYLAFLGISSQPFKQGENFIRHPFDILEVSKDHMKTIFEQTHFNNNRNNRNNRR